MLSEDTGVVNINTMHRRIYCKEWKLSEVV